jgi:hypothetical protein
MRIDVSAYFDSVACSNMYNAPRGSGTSLLVLNIFRGMNTADIEQNLKTSTGLGVFRALEKKLGWHMLIRSKLGDRG